MAISIKPQITFITGASSGIGRDCALHLHSRGYKVYGARRSIQQTNLNGITTLPIDVTDDASVQSAIDQIISVENRLDVVVNCAGFGIAGAIEDTSIEEAKAQFETNFFGTMRVCKYVLPIMRAQQSGLIVNVSSLGGLTSVPFQTVYCASKFALEGLTEALRMEVAPFGIHVVMIEPGDFATGFTAGRQRTKQSQSNNAYSEKYHKALSQMERDEMNGPSPQLIAQVLERILNTPKPRLRYTTGRLDQRLGVALKRVLPHSLYERILLQTYGLQ